MRIGLRDEHLAFAEAVRAWAARHVTRDVIRAAVDGQAEARPPFWEALAAQGLLGVHVPEQHGGSGQGLLEAAVVLEQLGRAMVPGPVLPTLLASAVLNDCGHTRYLRGLADGSLIGAVALKPGSLTITRDGATLLLTGQSAPVSGAVLADVVVLPARHRDAFAWVVVHRSQVEIGELISYDLTRRLGRVSADRVRIDGTKVLAVRDDHRVHDLAATLYAAEASGIAGWCVRTAAEYAKVREQFGRPIGQFQAVKHRCARMFVRSEQGRAAAWDAARTAGGESTPQAALAAAVAAVVAPDAAFGAAKDCVQVLGGIGFTWEHDAGLYLRRAHSTRLLLGSTARWQRRVAQLAMAGVRPVLGVELPPHAEGTRSRVRRELAPARELAGRERDAYLAEYGYTAPHLPLPWGKAADAVAQLVIAEELRTAGLRPFDMIIGGWVVPTLIAHGTQEQVQRFVPPSLRGDIIWCQLFSEPAAGSDLASLTTRAERVGGGWRLSGQKVWTSAGREANWGICLARTDPAAAKHKGLSYFLVDMSSPGIDVRPLRELTGDALFNEVFFDGVFVADDCLVGAPGDGWTLARTTLASERVALGYDSSLGAGGEALLEIAGQLGDLDSQQLSTLGALIADAHVGSVLALRATMRALEGAQPGAESSVGKLLGGEHIQLVWETAMDWLGPGALTRDTADRSSPARHFLSARCMTIAGGTTEVQLNIIGERLLGLPRDPRQLRGSAGPRAGSPSPAATG